MSSINRLLVLALDMGDGDLIRHWSGQGHLPRLASLMAGGAWFDLESTAQVLHTSTWPTFATGTLPGKHGVYFPYQAKPGFQMAQHVQADQYGVRTFWQLSDKQGCKCIVYDVPETFPETDFGGQGIFDWGTWAWYGMPATQPAGLMTQLKSRFGSYPLGFEAKRLGASIPDASVMKQRLLRSVDYKKRTAEWLLQQNPWDLAIVGFCEGHPAGHYLWPAEIDTVSQADAAKIKPLLEFYVALDRAIGALAHTLPSDTSLFIVSGDGVRPNRCAWYLLPAVLERLGYISPAGRSDNAQSVSPSLIGRVKRLVSPKMRRRIAQLLPWWLRDQIGAREQASNIDWSKTRAFTLPTDLEGCIRINLKGREPAGIVEPGAEYNDLCKEIRERLLELNNPDTGSPAVRQVWIRNQVFPGDRQEQLPDLMVSWNDEAPFTSLASTTIGRVDGETADLRPGTHSPRGFLLAAGDGISAGIVSRGHLVDVAPTVMKLLRLNVPAHMDGIPLRQLVDPLNREKSEQPVVTTGRH